MGSIGDNVLEVEVVDEDKASWNDEGCIYCCVMEGFIFNFKYFTVRSIIV